MASVQSAIASMVKNIEEKTGKPLSVWRNVNGAGKTGPPAGQSGGAEREWAAWVQITGMPQGRQGSCSLRGVNHFV